MKEHIISLLRYNDTANHTLLHTILQLPHRDEALRLFSHLISAQDKWMNRITNAAPDSQYQWYGPVYDADRIGGEWERSINAWKELISDTGETDLRQYIYFHRPADGRKMMLPLADLFLQINYHSMHHRAQINKLISAQGLPLPATDFIFTVLREAPAPDSV
ncbi:hypothetical protein GCM10023093_31690 [Nemorincola caseinilytica]|uniref:DinB-like domain-containing protein n=1 Tax=Nemorincola caseinilytica TaxID=2054315 RepID=A0ABP8NNX0_9BACT